MDEFNPHAYKNYEDLPLDQQDKFKAAPGGGFVPKSFIENEQVAIHEAYIERNIRNLDDLFEEKRRNLKARKAVKESLEALPTDQYAKTVKESKQAKKIYERGKGRLDGMGQSAEQQLLTLEDRKRIIIELIKKYRIEELVDAVFVDELLVLIDIWRVGTDAAELEENLEREYISAAKELLKIRHAREKYERGGEQKFSITLSGGRHMGIFLFEDQQRVGMEFMPFKNPMLHNIELGPEAVGEILGAKFTGEDYEQIAKVFCELTGPIGDVCRSYQEAVERWAQTYEETGQEDPDDRSIRRTAALDVTMAWSRNPEILQQTFSEIPLNAILYTDRN